MLGQQTTLIEKRLDKTGDIRMKRRLTMLIADDVEVNRASLRAIFEDEYKVVEAENGNVAIYELENRKIDIVILDLCMPGVDGAGVLKWMRSRTDYSQIPVIVKTAIDENTEGVMLELGADDFIFSPCNPAIIKKRVKNITQKYILEHELLYRQMEQERCFSRIKNHFTMAIFQKVCENLEEMMALSKTAQTEQDSRKIRGMLESFYEQGERMKELLGDIAEVYAIRKEKDECQEKVFSVREMAKQLATERNHVFEEGEILHEYLFGDVEHIRMLWEKLLSALGGGAGNKEKVKTCYHVTLLGERQAALKISAKTEVPVVIDETQYLILKSMVEMLQGTLQKEGQEKTVVSVTIPMKAGKIPVKKCRDFKSMRILSVGDESIYRDYYITILTRLGLRYDVAEEGNEALKLLRGAYHSGDGYDICFVNWQLEERQAAEFMAKVREIYDPDTLVLVCLSNGDEALESEIKKAGADYVMEKPVYQSTVYQVLTDICQKEENLES